MSIYSIRLNEADRNRLAKIEIKGKAIDPRFCAADAFRLVLRGYSSPDGAAASSEARARVAERKAQQLERQLKETERRLRKKASEDTRFHRQLQAMANGSPYHQVREHVRTGHRGRSEQVILDAVWIRYGKDWRRVLAALDAVRSGKDPPEPGGGP